MIGQLAMKRHALGACLAPPPPQDKLPSGAGTALPASGQSFNVSSWRDPSKFGVGDEGLHSTLSSDCLKESHGSRSVWICTQAVEAGDNQRFCL
jgi:hypothetical protein